MAPRDGLVHLKEYDFKDSNVELIGTDIDHRVKYASAATEPAWNNGVVGRQPGLFVWRVEDFRIVPVPAADVGVFYDGDSYIVLHSAKLHEKLRPEQLRPEQLRHDIFFWLGAHTSQDEAGTAAYKTVELDEFLQGTASQHRELQTSPSAAFLALFSRRLTIRRGGVASGFTHVDRADDAHAAAPLLLRVFKQPGARTDGGIVVHEVRASPSSLDDSDVFVLDSGSTVYVWQGRHCSPMEKAKAADVAQDLVTPAHTGGMQVLAQDEGRSGIVVRLLADADAGTEAEAQGPAASYSSPRPVAAPTATASSAGRPRPQRLWRLSDASGTLSFDLVRDGSAASADFDSNDVFLWDDAGREIWVWEGRGASAAERARWLQVAQAYVRQLLGSAGGDGHESAHQTPIAKVREGYESPAFWQSLITTAY